LAQPDIFLSYNREDAGVAKLFADAFTREGMDVWWDQALRSGQAYDKVTEQALRGAKAVVVLWSPRSVDSRWVRAEASIADEKGTLAPVKIEPCDLPVMFRLTQTADLSQWQGAADDRAWQAFLGDVRRMVGRQAPEAPAKPASAPASAGIGAPSKVAVRPIVHRGGGEDVEFLAEDLTEEITRELAEHDYFTVIAASTMEGWRGKAIDNRALGQELGARYVVEGKLQQAGETVRLTVQLIDAETANSLWSHRFTGNAAQMDEAPEDFPVIVASELGAQIQQTESSRVMTKPGPYSAWEHIMRSGSFTAASGLDSIRRAIEEGRQAVAAAPDLGMAHATLARAFGDSFAAGGAKLDTIRDDLQAQIARALQLDSNNPAVIGLLAAAYIPLGESGACLRLARRLVQMRPNSPQSHFMMGVAHLNLGECADAIASFEKQTRFHGYVRDRASGFGLLGWCYLVEGMSENAKEAFNDALALQPDHLLALRFKVLAEAQLGNEGGALAIVRRLREVEPDYTLRKHIGFFRLNPNVRERMAGHIETFQRLWEATEGNA